MLVINSPPTLPLLPPRAHFFFSFALSPVSLSPPSGEAEGEDERRTQQASLRHGGQATVRVQREAAAPSEGENGRPGRKGDLNVSSFLSETVSFPQIETLKMCPFPPNKPGVRYILSPLCPPGSDQLKLEQIPKLSPKLQ